LLPTAAHLKKQTHNSYVACTCAGKNPDCMQITWQAEA